MKLRYLTALAIVLLSALSSFAQKNKFSVLLKDASIVPEANITSAHITAFNQRTARFNNKTFAVLQFNELPSGETRKQLAAAGIELLEYIPYNSYTVSITGQANMGLLQRLKARSIFTLSPQQKMHPGLNKGTIPGWAQKASGMVEVSVHFLKTLPAAEVIASLQKDNFDIITTEYVEYNVLQLRVAKSRLTELAALPFVTYVAPAAPKVEPLNNRSRIGSKANMLNATIANGGKGLNGEGIVIGIGDMGNVTHTDLAGRIISRAPSLDNGHATWTHGNAAGAGIINELYKGYAPKATVVSDGFQNIIRRAGTYVQDYGMVITNNSYGGAFDCAYNGTYDFSSLILDLQAYYYPNLEHVFAAGNSGRASCPNYPAGFHTVLGSYQAAKNILVVGNCDDEGNLYNSSSRGPVRDGRIKPEIVADGTAVTSSWPNNAYRTDWGTSISAPSVSGGLALLYQRYRQLHNNANPNSALMKAIMCNGATDKGNDGPDYSYGFGYMNLVRSLDILESNHYFSGNSTNGSTNLQTISVPANTAQLKVMLYWHDPAASLLSSQALVNDLDLEVADPATNTILPLKLDTAAARVTATATTGADHINNIEQVVINNPASGNYTIRIKGTAIAQNPSQPYVVVYDAIPVSLQLTHPVGGEGLVPGEYTKIAWEAYGDVAATFTLQYSTDNGLNWADIATNINAASRYYNWQIPAAATDKALVRIIKDGTAQVSISNPFTIIGIPAVSLAATQCEGYMAVQWNAISDITDYEVMMLRGDEMVSIATTTATNYTISALSKDSVYWIGVRARINGQPGRRSVAVSRKPDNGNCTGNISDYDLKVDTIIAPVSGRKYTSAELTAATPVSIQIKNLDDGPVANFTVSYSINNSSWVTENVSTTIAAGGIYTHTFSTPANMAALGNYTLTAVVKNNTTDMVTANDTLITIIRHLDNPAIDLSTPFLDNLENGVAAIYQKNTTGLYGLDRYDFDISKPVGRLQTFVNTGIAYSGSKSFTLDKSDFSDDASVNYVRGTFNLLNYGANSNDLRLDFRYLLNGQTPDAYSRVWIRGKDTDPWIEVYRLVPTDSIESGIYALSPSIEIADSLRKNGQDFSSSFQVRWGQNAKDPAYDNMRIYSIDDIHLYQAINDMQLQSIDKPLALSCGLGNAVPIKVTVRNSDETNLINIPIKFSVNGGAWVTEIIPSVSSNTALSYTFTHMADLSGSGLYTIKVVVDYPTDNLRPNDTATLSLHNAPLVTTFPYLQNFENGDGGWYAGGINSSWQYGAPASARINRAASGSKAWKTRLSGNYNDEEYSYLYSPCFSIGSLAKPTLSFSVAMDMEDCGMVLCDAAWLEYSTDNKTWQHLTDTTASGTNGYQSYNNMVWSRQNYTYWHVATMPLPKEGNTIRFRFVFRSDEAINKEGVAIDDIHIYDNTKGIYEGTTASPVITQTINGGSNWIDFESGGKLIASLQPNNMNMGSTAIWAFINAAGVRDTANQYYHDRNIILQPANNPLPDSVGVRLYFTDAEMEALMNAAGCATCIQPASAYDLGISQYSNTNRALENGTMGDNTGGKWAFIQPGDMAIVPFDKGYYAEFKVNHFSEFWLSKAAFNSFIALPVHIVSFTAQKTAGNQVLLKWQVTAETDVDGYAVEVARTSEALQTSRFEPVGYVKSTTATSAGYMFTDDKKCTSGVCYYRIKMINKNGTFTYSPVRSVLFTDEVKGTIFPNPSNGLFHFIYQLAAGEVMIVKVTDATGRTIYQHQVIGDGLMQKQIIDVSDSRYAAGVYLLQAVKGGQQQSFKLYKQ